MYSLASGTIVSAGTSSPSKPGTQPVSSNISLAFSKRVLASLVNALPMVGFLAWFSGDRFRGTVRFLRRHEHCRGQAPSFGGVAETFDARNRGARVQAMDI